MECRSDSSIKHLIAFGSAWCYPFTSSMVGISYEPSKQMHLILSLVLWSSGPLLMGVWWFAELQALLSSVGICCLWGGQCNCGSQLSQHVWTDDGAEPEVSTGDTSPMGPGVPCSVSNLAPPYMYRGICLALGLTPWVPILTVTLNFQINNKEKIFFWNGTTRAC